MFLLPLFGEKVVYDRDMGAERQTKGIYRMGLERVKSVGCCLALDFWGFDAPGWMQRAVHQRP